MDCAPAWWLRFATSHTSSHLIASMTRKGNATKHLRESPTCLPRAAAKSLAKRENTHSRLINDMLLSGGHSGCVHPPHAHTLERRRIKAARQTQTTLKSPTGPKGGVVPSETRLSNQGTHHTTGDCDSSLHNLARSGSTRSSISNGLSPDAAAAPPPPPRPLPPLPTLLTRGCLLSLGLTCSPIPRPLLAPSLPRTRSSISLQLPSPPPSLPRADSPPSGYPPSSPDSG